VKIHRVNRPARPRDVALFRRELIYRAGPVDSISAHRWHSCPARPGAGGVCDFNPSIGRECQHRGDGALHCGRGRQYRRHLGDRFRPPGDVPLRTMRCGGRGGKFRGSYSSCARRVDGRGGERLTTPDVSPRRSSLVNVPSRLAEHGRSRSRLPGAVYAGERVRFEIDLHPPARAC